MTTPDAGAVVSCVEEDGWLTLKVAWPVSSDTHRHLGGRVSSGTKKLGVTNAGRPFNRKGDDGIWTFNTTKGLKAQTVDGKSIDTLSAGDRVVITHSKHIRPPNIYLSPEQIIVHS